MHCLKTKKKNHKIFCSMYMHALGSIFEFLFFCVDIFFRSCCDANAECTCSTISGHYSCLCAPGYYGSGLIDNCQRMSTVDITHNSLSINSLELVQS